MKANRTARSADEAVSPVIAVILMVAITVVLAATVYIFVTGFGAQQTQIVTAGFAAKAVDLPGASGDTDTTDDTIEITYSTGNQDLGSTDVEIFVDGVSLTWFAGAGNRVFVQGANVGQNNEWCGSSPGGVDDDDTFERGAFTYIVRTGAAVASSITLCDATPTIASMADITGLHQVKVVTRGQVVLDTSVQVHDSLAS